jgi:hypothetical protein
MPFRNRITPVFSGFIPNLRGITPRFRQLCRMRLRFFLAQMEEQIVKTTMIYESRDAQSLGCLIKLFFLLDDDAIKSVFYAVKANCLAVFPPKI